jgi:hypothetical protein
MHEASLFLLFVRPLANLKSRYMVTGSVAATIYAEPRLTHDVDIVLELDNDEVRVRDSLRNF